MPSLHNTPLATSRQHPSFAFAFNSQQQQQWLGPAGPPPAVAGQVSQSLTDGATRGGFGQGAGGLAAGRGRAGFLHAGPDAAAAQPRWAQEEEGSSSAAAMTATSPDLPPITFVGGLGINVSVCAP